ncbi:MAG: hypothetical protein ACE5E5_02745 [Phycisphaerae bacterium]
MSMFDYDWFHGQAFQDQCREAMWRCAMMHYPEVTRENIDDHPEALAYRDSLLIRSLVYLRDGFSYEVKEFADVETKSHLVFECEPMDLQYKVGSFVVSVPFDEIVRVEVFAVHPSAKPEDFPQITGFHAQPERGDVQPPDGPPLR